METARQPPSRPCSLAIVALALALACGASSAGPRPPGPPATLVADTGAGAFAMGWDPPSDPGSSAVDDYLVTVSPELAGSGATAGRAALLGGAANGTTYTVTVVARSAAGAGAPRTVQVTPRAYSAAAERALVVSGDDSPSGIYDPSVLVSGAHAWLAYSSVDYHLDAQDHRVQDVGIRLARSDDAGATWTFVRTVAAPSADVSVADPLPGHPVCGAATCTGHWVHETAWLVEDPTAPAAERFLLLAHQYFLYPPDATVDGKSATQYHLGAIVAWTAASPGELGAAPARTVLRWDLTPAVHFTGGQNVNALPGLEGCLAVAEGSATARGGGLDLALTCPYGSGSPTPQKVVLLRSTDHARTFSLVATLLEPSDASELPGASFFTAPALLAAADAAPVLVVTPSFGGVYGGCAVIPFADPATGTLRRKENGKPAVIRLDPTAAGTMGGACAVARALPAVGLLRTEASRLAPADWPPVFRILRGGGL
jgi:hypothetical protein